MTFIFPIMYPSQRMFISLCVVFAVLPVVAMFLRVLARRKANRKLDLSDKIMIGATCLLVVYQGVNISAVLVGGLGIPGDVIQNRFGVFPTQERFIKHLLAMQVMWTTDITIVKISILTLYTRIFTLRQFIIAAKVTMGACVAWMIIMGVGSVFICRPFALYWDPTLPGQCGDLLAFWIFTGTFNIITDLTILILPMPYLYGLEIALYKKLVLIATFGIGFLVCIVSAVRLKALVGYEQADSTGTTIPTALLSVMEPALGIILGCVPLLRPLFGGRYSATGTAQVGPRTGTGENKNSNHSGHSHGSHGSSSRRTFNKMKNDMTIDEDACSDTQLRPDGNDYEVEAGRHTPGANSARTASVEMGRISMKKTWAVDEEMALEGLKSPIISSPTRTYHTTPVYTTTPHITTTTTAQRVDHSNARGAADDDGMEIHEVGVGSPAPVYSSPTRSVRAQWGPRPARQDCDYCQSRHSLPPPVEGAVKGETHAI